MEKENSRYVVKRYGRWHWAILDTKLNLLLRVGPNPDYTKPLDTGSNKLLLFKDCSEAKQHCAELNIRNS